MTAPSIVASQGCDVSTGATPAFDSTTANAIVVWAAYGGAPGVPTDNKGNTYTARTPAASSPTGRFYDCLNANVGPGHIVTFGGSAFASSAEVYALANVALTGAYSSPGATTLAAGATSATFGAAITTPENDCIVFVGCAQGTSPITSIAGANGWAIPRSISGAGGLYGSLLAYKVLALAGTISSSEVYATWSGSGNGSAPQVAAIYKSLPAGGGSITLTSPMPYEPHPRSGSTGSIQISGSSSGASLDIEAAFNGGAFATIATAVAPGPFTGVLTGQAQGQGTLTVGKVGFPATRVTVAYVSITDIFVDGGDSRDEGRGTNGQVYTHGSLKAVMFKAGAWAELTESAGAGTIWPRVATRFMASQGVPFAIIRNGTGSTDLAGTHAEWAKPNAQYSGLVTAVSNSTVSGVKAALFLLGPNAIVNSNSAAISLATYRTALDTLATNLAADLPGAPKLLVDVCGEVGTGSPPDRRTAQDNIRGAILSAWNNNPTAIKGGPVLIDQDYVDNVHLTTDADLNVGGDRYWLAIEAGLYSGSNGRGPRISSATWNLARNQITVVFDRALKTGLTHAVQPWLVKDNGSAMTVSSVAYHGSNANALLVNLSAAATGAANTTTLSFASGDDAVGRVVPLSLDITLPGTGTVNMPAEPVSAYAVAENTSLATTVTVTLTTDGSTPAAGLTGLRWAFFDQVQPSGFLAPVAKGSGASTNGSGVFSVNIAGSALAVGATGWLEISDSDGTVGQAGGHKRASGPVTVS